MRAELVVFVSLLGSFSFAAAENELAEPPAEPAVVSIFPQGANPGTTIEAQVRGETLEGTYAVWFDTQGLRARVRKIENIRIAAVKAYSREPLKDQLGHRVQLEIQISDAARIGSHSMRLVSPRGVSNALTFWIHADQVIRESLEPHQTADRAQALKVPAVVQGRISQEGELDYYEVQVTRGQQLAFEVIPKPDLKPRLVLYEATGSWFDPHRTREVAFTAYDKEYGVESTRLTHRFDKTGRYLVQVGSRFSVGGPDVLYQLRVRPGDEVTPEEEEGPRATVADWQERTFVREIVPERLQVLWSRTVPTSGDESETEKNAASNQAGAPPPAGEPGEYPSLAATPVLVGEKEPNETVSQALELSLPVVIEGVIEHPGDRDHFKFQVNSGERLAFEVETPDSTLPRFTPRMGILDGDGNELLTNIYRKLGRQFQFYLKTVEPKTVHTFELGGEYSLEMRDATASYGDPSFVYRVLIRRQIPHVGEVRLKEDRINVVRGEARKLTLTTGQEEGFGGDIALTVENLPPGVEALPGTEVETDRGINPDEGPKDKFLAKTQKATILLMASKDAALTSSPRFLRVKARPVVDGKPGMPIPVAEIPLMVVEEGAEAHGGAP